MSDHTATKPEDLKPLIDPKMWIGFDAGTLSFGLKS